MKKLEDIKNGKYGRLIFFFSLLAGILFIYSGLESKSHAGG